MANIIKGTDVAASIKSELKNIIEENNLTPTLAVVRVGEKGSDLAYEKGVRKTCENVGIDMKVFSFPEDISQKEMEQNFISINNDPDVDGILLFKPLPKQLDENVFNELIDPEKDMDCMSPANWSRLALGDESGFCPCTAEAVIRIIEYAGIDISGKNAVVIGRSQVIGKPVSLLLLKRNATVTICHSKTRDIAKTAEGADILVCACGKADLVGEEIAQGLSENCIAIDVGMNFVDGKMCGDFNFDEVEPHVSYITPVPGGVGSVTNTVMASHVVKAALNSKKIQTI